MYTKLKELINLSNNIVFFGGAGVSTESGIPDFRSSKGIFNPDKNINYSPETIVSHSFFMKNPEFFYDFYKTKMIYENAKPNDAHKALAKLEEQGKLKSIITQNIDGLHQMAGSKKVIELHGSINRNYCMNCHSTYDLKYVLSNEAIPHCEKCNGIVRPDVVLYEEALNEDVISDAVMYLSKADMLIIGGTSLVVYPAAGLIRYFKGSHLVLINKSSTSQDSNADIVINESIGKVLGSIIL